ncbi:hypothetical protein HAX54_044390 [Datura stramonium]|uniref:Uncharacterized protein n=1 Tax=Datura stramonium TaxID=4076 RepID=A0ABS8SPH3_DATST|nr:hypothetical protein [Datura stramonium]
MSEKAKVIDVIKASTDDLGPLSLDSFRKNNLSASWKFVGQETVAKKSAVDAKVNKASQMAAADSKPEITRGKHDGPVDGDHSQFLDSPAKLARRRDDDVTVKLENTAIERSKSVDSSVLRKTRLKESRRALGDAGTDADLTHRALLSQLAAKTIPNGIHCLSMRLTIDYYLLPPEKESSLGENPGNPDLFHYALFSDNVLAASVVVNSTIVNAKEPEKHVFPSSQ